MTDYAFQARGLVKRFGRTTALAGVELSARPGSVLGVLGPNGAGKPKTDLRLNRDIRLELDILASKSLEALLLLAKPESYTSRAETESKIGVSCSDQVRSVLRFHWNPDSLRHCCNLYPAIASLRTHTSAPSP